MASVAGALGGFGQASYSATKAGLIGFTRSLALRGARYNITVNAVVPGIINTEAFKMGNPKMNERMIARTAFRRPGEFCDPQMISMGYTAEMVARRYGISREKQDRFAVESHAKAYRATVEGPFREEILPVEADVHWFFGPL